MPISPTNQPILVLGVGNTLLQDDGAGVRVIEALGTTHRHLLAPGAAGRNQAGGGIELVDAGTIGLALLPAVERAAALIVVDAAELDRAPGALAVFRDRDIDRLLAGRRRSVHEIALADLFTAAALRGRLPARRALVAIQPGCTDWGLQPTPAVRAALPGACAAVASLLQEWRAPKARCA